MFNERLTTLAMCLSLGIATTAFAADEPAARLPAPATRSANEAGATVSTPSTPLTTGALPAAVSTATAPADAAAAVPTTAAPVAATTPENRPSSRPAADVIEEGPKQDAASAASAPPAATRAPAAASASTPPIQASVAPASPNPVSTPAAMAPPAQPGTPPVTAAATPPTPAPNPINAALEAQVGALQASGTSGDKADTAALAPFYSARKWQPLWIGADGKPNESAGKVVETLKSADDWGLEAAAFRLPDLAATASPTATAEAETALTIAALKYARHARGGRMDPYSQLSRNLDRNPELVPPQAILEQFAAAGTEPGKYLLGLHPRHPQFERLRLKYLEALRGARVPQVVEAEEPAKPTKKGSGKAKAPAKAQPLTGKALAQKLLVNMEQWRWMPQELGKFHVWANIPEFAVRVMRDGQPIHAERLIVGKPNTQTPVFSDEMEQVIFHPFWGVPDSIKRNEILPSLAGGGSVLARHNLRISYKGRPIDPSSVDWSKTDIRNFHIYQPPGAGNVLGVVKFRFPNKHDVYMHDTPTKGLFASAKPMYSHGCMRVRNPLKLAEYVLAEDRNWGAAQVAAAVAKGGQDHQINLTTKVPVHITYFTASVSDDGKLKTVGDIYGHETRIALGIAGKFGQIPRTPEASRAQPIGRLVEAKPSGPRGWAENAFSNQ